MTRFHLIRHAIVDPAARAILYGRMDVSLCPATLTAQAQAYRVIAARLPREAAWLVTPLSRTARTADAIQQAGYPATQPAIEPGLIEQDLGAWQGLAHADLPAHLTEPAHAFWPLGATETPPGGESMQDVVIRVGETLERLVETHPNQDVIAITHGGAIRAALAHATGAGAHAALHFAVANLSLTVLERFAEGWRIVCVNECASGLAA
jgi:broad specificity phosphatase PhoE